MSALQYIHSDGAIKPKAVVAPISRSRTCLFLRSEFCRVVCDIDHVKRSNVKYVYEKVILAMNAT
jgi:hypothetical protein